MEKALKTLDYATPDELLSKLLSTKQGKAKLQMHIDVLHPKGITLDILKENRKTFIVFMDTLKKLAKAIFKFYPDARITAIGRNQQACILHFLAWGGYGSDSVHITEDGELWQMISGDLNLITLDELEKATKKICAEYAKLVREERVSQGMKDLFG